MTKSDIEQVLHDELNQYREFGIAKQVDYDRFYLYSIITNSTAIEGSTLTEIENQLLFDEGITAQNRSLHKQLMNLDLRRAYEQSISLATQHTDFSIDMLKHLSAAVMKNTGNIYNTMLGSFDASQGDLRLVNVMAGFEGDSYLDLHKVPIAIEQFCKWINNQRAIVGNDEVEQYKLSFDAHLRLVTILPWGGGNGRMARLVMNHLQFKYDLITQRKNNNTQYI